MYLFLKKMIYGKARNINGRNGMEFLIVDKHLFGRLILKITQNKIKED